jgi:CRISPR-associated protein Csd1
MILQSLYQLYQRIPDIDRPGFAPLGLSWTIVLNKSGELESLYPLRREAKRGNKPIPIPISAPSPGKRTSNDKAGFLADKSDYILGFDPAANGNPKAMEKLKERYKLFRDKHLAAQQAIAHPDFDAVCAFLRSWDPADSCNSERLSRAANAAIEEIIGTNLGFEISGKIGFVHQLSEVETFWSQEASKEKKPHTGTCLVTGENHDLKLVHPAINGIHDEPGKPSQKGIVVFQTAKRAFSSYGKDGLQGINAPVSIRAALGYSSALNWLIAHRRFRIGDATTVFWTAEPTPTETLLPWMMSGHAEAENKDTKDRVAALLKRVARGTLGPDELGASNVPYFILGLSPNSSRVSIRFWLTGSLGNLIENLQLHFKQLELLREWDETNSPKPEPLAPTAKDLILQTVPLKDGRRDESRASPLLAGALMQAIITGTRYPESMAQAVMNRIRVIEKNPRGNGTLQHVTYLRTAILKAWLIRNHGDWLNQHSITMTTALNTDNPSIAYQLGRLFAVYEQAQRAAHGGKLERTIRESMFSAASATPLAVFVRLDKLNKHHLQKLRQGSNRFFSNLIDEIHQKINGSGPLPPSLDLKGQSLFCIGYYHQRHDLK